MTLGLTVSDRTLYAIERGEQVPGWDVLVALVLALEPPGGARFFWPSIAPAQVSRFIALSTESENAAIERTADNTYYGAVADLAREKAAR